MKFKLLLLPMLVALCYISISCVNNSEEDLYGLECNTTDMTYAKIKYIFDDNCNSSSCHNAAQGSYNIKLNSYLEVQVAVNKGRLIGAINHNGGFEPMPNGKPKLDDCLIAKIEAWINDGMPEN